jgi:hypothetical protein
MIVLPLLPLPGAGCVVFVGVVCSGVAVVECLLGLSLGELLALLPLGCLLRELGLEFAVELTLSQCCCPTENAKIRIQEKTKIAVTVIIKKTVGRALTSGCTMPGVFTG